MWIPSPIGFHQAWCRHHTSDATAILFHCNLLLSKWAPHSLSDRTTLAICWVKSVHSHFQQESCFFTVGNPETSQLSIDVINVFLHHLTTHAILWHDCNASIKSIAVVHNTSSPRTKTLWILSSNIPSIYTSPHNNFGNNPIHNCLKKGCCYLQVTMLWWSSFTSTACFLCLI